MWLHILLGPCWCVYIALLGSSTSEHVGAVLMLILMHILKFFVKTIHLCISWWIKKLDNIKMHAMYVRKIKKVKKTPEYLSFCHKIKWCSSSWKSGCHTSYWKYIKNVNKCMMKTAEKFSWKSSNSLINQSFLQTCQPNVWLGMRRTVSAKTKV